MAKDTKEKKKANSAQKAASKAGSKPQSKAERKANKKLQEQLQRKRRTRTNAITAAIVVAIAVTGLLIVLRINQPKGEMTLPNDGITEFCDAVQSFDIDERRHVEEGQPVSYPQDPPVGGLHWGSPPPPDDGFYTTEIPKELTTHSLEHGQIIIWYNQGDDKIAGQLKDAIAEKKSFLVAVPRSEPLPGGARMVLTAWGRSQSCRDFDMQALRQFQEFFKNKGPERIRMG